MLFTYPWEQRKLGELADGVFGGGTPKTSIDTYWNGSIPWIQSSNLMDDKIENFINDKSITNLAIKESATKLIPANSIAIVTRVGVGKVALIREKFATSQDFLSFHCRHEHNPLFMSYQISRLMKVKSRLLQGTSIKGITKSEVLESEVLIPKGIEEENKIADFLSSCDNLITLHQRKLEHLKLKKKSLLQKLFPKEGEVYPEFRFPGFTDPWEQRKFGELFLERREKTTEENEDILLSCAITGIYLNSDLFSHFRGSSTVGYLKVRKNDLILSAQNLHLGNANINFNFEHGMISPAYKVFEIESCDPYFVNAWVKKESTKIFFLKATTEGASQCRKNIDWDALINQELLTPNALEQETIGKFFNQLDRYITLHQRKLEHLQLLKKALLQQLFV